MKIAALFPGQGSQAVGMPKALIENFPWTKAIYEEASDALHEDLLRLCLEGPADRLQLTENAQPAILTTSYAWFEVLRKGLDFRPAAGSGHSLGEYSALLAAGALTLSEAVPLVRTRGRLMQAAVPVGKGKMAALLGLDDDKVIALCERASEGEHSLVVAANFNAPAQVVIAGHTDAVERAEAMAATPEFAARKVIPLNVSAPFHSPLMSGVARDFVSYLQGVEWKKPVFPVVNNLDGRWRAEGDWASLLRDQIDHPVRWTACVRTLETQGMSAFVEMGPGSVLTALVKRTTKAAKLFSVDSLESMKKLETALKEGL